ncbi:MAG TPA: protein kinase, partial [Miltoncostaeaceae bacterium]|nr:protein kinase [Miltoncostaeaceae bacterium]
MDGVRPGDVIGGRYRIEDVLGTGGMARVYRAQDQELGRPVAVKVLADRYAADPTFVERFRREASAAAQLNHPNIVQVFDRGEAGETYYIVMEYLPGPDLKTIIRRRGTISADETVEAGLQILSALAAAHRRDVIHRDVKPQNVIMADDGTLKVTDFGIARAGADSEMTEAGSVIGTAQYLSPEQARGGEVTPSSDCYAVGIVLYEMLTGRVPFDAERPVAVAMKQINEPPVPPSVYEPSVPAELEGVVLKALAKRPSERYRTADEFSAALHDVRARLDGVTGQTGVLGPATAGTRVMEPPASA